MIRCFSFPPRPRLYHFSLLLSLFAAGPAIATDIDADWNGGDGDWSAANWLFSPAPTLALFPNNDALNSEFFHVEVAPGSDTLTLDLSTTIDSLLLGSGNTLNVEAGNSLRIEQDGGRALSGSLTNAGLIDLQADATFSASLRVAGEVTLDGGGEIRLSGPLVQTVFNADDAPQGVRGRATISGSGSLTNVDNTIAGSGFLGSTSTGLFNLAGGTIDANVTGGSLVLLGDDPAGIGTSGVTNLGIMQASNGGILRLFFGTYRQDDTIDSGAIQALAGSTVQIENSGLEILGGELNSVGDGTILIRSASVDLDGVSVNNAGSLLIERDANGNPSSLDLINSSLGNSGLVRVDRSSLSLANSTVNNSGLIEVISSDTQTGSINIQGAVSLEGGGTLRLSGPPVVTVFSGDDAPQPLRGRGTLGGNGALTNIDNTIEGTGFLGGTSTGLFNLAGGTIDANVAGGSLVLLGDDPAGIGGGGATNLGVMQASDGGTLRLFFGTYRQDDTIDSGAIQALAGSTVHMENSGIDILGGELNTFGDGTVLLRSASVDLEGVSVNNAGSLLIERDAAGGASSLELINGSLGNSGLVSVDRSSLSLANSTVNNSSLIEVISSDTQTGSISIQGDVSLEGGGTVRLSGPPVVTVLGSDDAPQALRARTTLGGNGSLTNIDNTIEGTGFLGNTVTRLFNLAGGTIDANVAGGSLVVLGDDPAGIATNGVTNLGVMQASDGGTLRLFFGTYRQDDTIDSGAIQALAGSTVHVENSGLEILGGELNTLGDGTVLLRSASVDLDGVAVNNAGSLIIERDAGGSASSLELINGSLGNSGLVRVDRSSLSLANSAVNNSGLIEVISSDTETGSINVQGDVSLSGGGSVRLSGPPVVTVLSSDDAPQSLRARSTFRGSGSLTNIDNTIEGSGFLGNTVTGLFNLAGGTIDANVAGGSLVVLGDDPAGIATNGVTNLGIMQASNGGTLRLFFGTYRQDDSVDSGVIQALAGSTVQVENSGLEILGGELNTVDDGTVLLRSGFVTLNNASVNNAGSLIIEQDVNGTGSTLRLEGGGITNSGSVQVTGSSIQGNGSYVQTGGETVLDDGLLEASDILVTAGMLRGNGTIAGPAEIFGILDPGLNDIGSLSFNGDLDLGGIFNVELGGALLPGVDYDFVDVAGTASLFDSLSINILLGDVGGNPFAPTLGDTFNILEADFINVSDLGALFNFPILAGGLAFSADIIGLENRSALQLTVIDGLANRVDEPAALLLLLLSLPLMLFGRKKSPGPKH